MGDKKIAVITGVNGQDGSYLSELLLAKDYAVIGLKRRTSTINTSRIDHLVDNHDFTLKYYDLLDSMCMTKILKENNVSEIYNLAAQSHVAVSFEIPGFTSDGICNGTLNILEAIRCISPNTRFYQASSSEMYGDSKDFDHDLGFDETSRMTPVSPYAVAKLHAHHMTRTYRQAYGLHASCGILFNHEAPRRGETFVTRKITIAASKIKAGLQDKIHLGNLESKRDWGFAGDYVDAMWRMLQHEHGDDYVVATGNTYKISDFLDIVFKYAELGVFRNYVEIDPRLFRPNEVPYLKGNPAKAKKILKWNPTCDLECLAKMMFDHDYNLIKNGKNL